MIRSLLRGSLPSRSVAMGLLCAGCGTDQVVVVAGGVPLAALPATLSLRRDDSPCTAHRVTLLGNGTLTRVSWLPSRGTVEDVVPPDLGALQVEDAVTLTVGYCPVSATCSAGLLVFTFDNAPPLAVPAEEPEP